MSSRYNCGDGQSAVGIRAAVASLRRGNLVVIPTDTVYGVCADAFNPSAMAELMTARGQGRQAPPTILVGTVRAGTALVENLSSTAKDFIDEFWPGALTLVCRANRTLSWDLGDSRGTVAIRMPLHQVALDLLKETGPLAVSSASRSGSPAAASADEAEAQLGDAVSVYLDDGPCSGSLRSTILDLTGPMPRVLREGAIPLGRLSSVTIVAPMTPAEPPIPHTLDEPTDGDAEAAEGHGVSVPSEGPAEDGAPGAPGEA
ncbi:MAG TPA: L-threonylcarbamoyladenylate synthase [Streptosporangiaceae bacterium]|jgi:tRNA threonylcarbamoyl adenosine modification protein (Sua5/YciO/YrdC/YwlC family)